MLHLCVYSACEIFIKLQKPRAHFQLLSYRFMYLLRRSVLTNRLIEIIIPPAYFSRLSLFQDMESPIVHQPNTFSREALPQNTHRTWQTYPKFWTYPINTREDTSHLEAKKRDTQTHMHTHTDTHTSATTLCF